MKIAYVVYPSMNLYDFMSLYEPLQQLYSKGLLSDLEVDCCAPPPLPPFGERMLEFIAVKVKIISNLSDYDILIVPGNTSGALEAEDGLGDSFLAWLRTAHPVPIKAAVGAAVELLERAGMTENSQVIPMGQILCQRQPAVESEKWQATPKRPVILTAKNRSETLEIGFQICGHLVGNSASKEAADVRGYPAAQINILTQDLNPERRAKVARETGETIVDVELFLDGTGRHTVQTGIPFLDHMLTQVAIHGLFDLSIQAKGDLEVDPHHTVEDVALTLGKAFDQALGDRKGLVRMASATVPMDESLAQVSLDFSGRPYAVVDATWHATQVGGISTTMITHFMESFSTQARCNLHVRLLAGGDDHHRAEAIFKALGRAVDAATQIDPRRIGSVPSSKGTI